MYRHPHSATASVAVVSVLTLFGCASTADRAEGTSQDIVATSSGSSSPPAASNGGSLLSCKDGKRSLLLSAARSGSGWEILGSEQVEEPGFQPSGSEISFFPTEVFKGKVAYYFRSSESQRGSYSWTSPAPFTDQPPGETDAAGRHTIAFGTISISLGAPGAIGEVAIQSKDDAVLDAPYNAPFRTADGAVCQLNAPLFDAIVQALEIGGPNKGGDG